ncbi:hypothetical protein, partial [Dysosmobacter sp.]|uniref:hypothetical protein n=1 Tax=Dysosmobacter sp. TaxID=2591382 RepID=UPI003AF08A68
IIQRYKREELWKYYLVQSYRNSMMCFGKELEDDEISFLEKLYFKYSIEHEFTEKTPKSGAKKPYAYIDRNYGWTYKVNRNFTFAGLCELVDKNEYDDFKIMSIYSHGTTAHLKMDNNVSIAHIMNMISSLYVGLYRLVNIYCLDTICEEFYGVAHKIEKHIYRCLD